MISTIDPQAADFGQGLAAQVEILFSPKGTLSKSRNFEYRPQQQRMAVAVAHALENRNHLAVEAGTGVGKSLAYLIPSILYAVANRRKAVISTHTINLQEQLIEKDLPMLEKILPVEFNYTMLKGRQNYVCSRRLRKAMLQADSLFTSSETEELRRIFEWSKTSQNGSLSDFEVEPDPKVWSQVCSERGLCSPKSCGHSSDFAKEHGPCPFQRARSRFLSSDVLVVNHTLFFTLLGGVDEDADSEGILFKNDFIVFDEAHTVESVASRHIGVRVSSAQVRFALHRLWNSRTQKGLLAASRNNPAMNAVEEALGHADEFFASVEHACEEIFQAAQSRAAETRGRAWSELRIRAPDVVPDTVTLSLQRVREAVSGLIKTTNDSETGQELVECNLRLAELREEIAVFLEQSARDHVYWIERAGRTQQNISLNAAPVDVADFLRRRLFGSNTSVIMTSATLSVDDSSRTEPAPSARLPKAPAAPATNGLNYFARRVGAESATLLQAGSPFDYERQMRMFVVQKMPDPREAGYREALVHWIEHFIGMTGGKAFVLFTNFKLMREVSECMEPFFRRHSLECFVQGAGTPRSLMLEKFKQDVNSVLFGTDSFWQGVDVPGEALSNVILTRLPFAVPDHPLVEARVEDIEAKGGNSFMEFSLPEAILKFRQGVGRLIRTRNDTGIVVVLDNRILTKRYGKNFFDALPKCPVEIV